MASETTNLKLTLPALTDPVDVDILNGNFTTIDDLVLLKSGGTMTGNLTVGSAKMETNGYVTATWIRTTASIHLGSTPSDIAVLNGGWIYSRTLAEFKSDLGIGSATAITLSASGWSGSAGSYTQTVTATGVTATNDVLITCAGNISFEASSQIGANIVRASAQAANALTFTANVKPTVDIPLVFKVL